MIAYKCFKSSKMNIPLKKLNHIVNKYYDKSKQTKNIINNFGFMFFTKYFKYLGSWVSYNLDDTYVIISRIIKANQVMGAIKFLMNFLQVGIRSKLHIQLATPINLLLWGCESCAMNQDSLH